jgi:hypothetical protein
MFDLATWLTKIIGPWGLQGVVDDIVAFCETKKNEYPDVAKYTGAIEVFLKEKLAPYLDPVKDALMIKAIASVIASGMTGTDPDAWTGSV